MPSMQQTETCFAISQPIGADLERAFHRVLARTAAESLARRGRPTRIIRVDRVCERTLGALFMHFMLETIRVAHIRGVETFDQPAVGEGKAPARHDLQERPPP